MAEVVGLSTSREVWLALENTFSHRSKAHEIRLKDELQSMKRGTRSVAEYFLAFKALCDQLHAIGRPIDETDKAHWFLRGLGAIPPPAKASHRRGRGRRGCNPFCSCRECLVGCIFNCIFQIILTLIVVLGVIALVLWLLFRPNAVKFYATEARLTRFDYSNTTLYYDMTLNITIRNANRRLGIYYDNIEVRTFYEGQRFATNTLIPFYQGHKNTTDLRTDFNGQQFVLLGSSAVDNYNGQKSSGRYDVDVKLYLRARFKWGIIKSWRFRPKIKCELKVPLQSITGSNSVPFETTRCHFDW